MSGATPERRALEALVWGPSIDTTNDGERTLPPAPGALDYLAMCLAVGRARERSELEARGDATTDGTPSIASASPTPQPTSPISPVVSLFDVEGEDSIDTIVLVAPHAPPGERGIRSPRPQRLMQVREPAPRVSARWHAVNKLLKGLPTLRKAATSKGRDAERLEALLEPTRNKSSAALAVGEIVHVVETRDGLAVAPVGCSEAAKSSTSTSPCERVPGLWEDAGATPFGLQLVAMESGRLILSAVLTPPRSAELESSTGSNLSGGKGMSGSRHRSPGSSTASYIPCAVLSTLADVYYRICVNRQQKPMPSFLKSLQSFRLGDTQFGVESSKSSQAPSRSPSEANVLNCFGTFPEPVADRRSPDNAPADLLCRSFTALDLSPFCSGPKGTFAALGILFHTPNVQLISLRGCGIDTSTVEFLCLIAALGLPKLRQLDLRDNPTMDFAAGGHLQRLAAKSSPPLTSILLDGTNVRPSTIRSIESHLKRRCRGRNASTRTSGCVTSPATRSPSNASKTTAAMDESSTSSAAGGHSLISPTADSNTSWPAAGSHFSESGPGAQ